MAIQQFTGTNTGSIEGLVARDADLERRIRVLEAQRTVISANAIGGSQIGPNSINGGHIIASTIDASHISANSINATHIQANAIQTTHLAANVVTAAKIAADTITANEIAANAITTVELDAGAVTAAKIAADTITASQIAADAITTSELAANAVTAAKIAANTITAAQIAANTITASQIAASTITATEIAANTITSNKLSVTTLSSITTNMGSITAGTITGGTLQTASSGARVVMDSAGLRGYALDGTTKVFEINAGSGIASFTGTATLQAGSVVPGSLITGTVPATSVPAIGGGNMLPDSSFEASNVSGYWSTWDGGTGSPTIDTTGKYGTKSATKVAVGGNLVYFWRAGSGIRAEPGDKVAVSGWFKGPSGTSFVVGFRTYNSIGTSLGDTIGSAVAMDGTWKRVTALLTVPATGYTIAFISRTAGNATAGQQFWADALQLEFGEVVTAYAPMVSEILPGAVGTTELASNAVTAAKITDGTITTAKIGASQITNALMAANSVDVNQIVADAVTAAKIAAGAVGTSEIAANAVTVTQIADDAVTTPKLIANAVTAAKIAANTITASQIAAGTITTNEIAANTIQAADIAANTITAAQIAANTITASQIASGTITATQIASSTITATQLAAGSVTANKLSIIAGGGNIIPDSSFESTAALAWSGASVSIARSTTQKRFGANSAAVTYVSGTDPYTAISLDATQFRGQPVTYSAWIYVPSTLGAQVGSTTDRALLIYDGFGSTSVAVSTITRDTWVRVTCPALTVNAAATTLQIRLYNIYSTGSIYYDGLQVEAGDVPTAYSPKPDEILPGTIVASMIATDAITANEIQAGAIGSSEIAAGAIVAGKIAAGAINAANIIVSGTITGTQIANTTIDGANIKTATIDATNIKTGTITATQIAAGAITANLIAAGAITAQKLSLTMGGGNILGDSSFESSATASNWAVYQGTWATDNSAGNFRRVGKSALVTLGAFTTCGIYGNSSVTRMPVSVGDVVTVSAWVKTGVGSRTVGISARYTLNGAYVGAGSGTGTNSSSSTSWTRIWTTVTIPAGTNEVGVYVAISGATAGDTFWVDDVQIEYGDVLTGYAPKPDEILPGTVGATQITPNSITTNEILAGTIQASDIASGTITSTQIAANTITASNLNVGVGGGNLAPNSSFESTSTTYTGGYSNTGYAANCTVAGSTVGFGAGRLTGQSISITTPASGSGSFTVANRDIATTPNTKAQVAAGLTYTNSIWVKPTVTGSYTLYLTFHASATGAATQTTTVVKSCPANVWTRITATATAPAGATHAGMYLYQASATLSCTTLVDDFQLEEGDVATSYAPVTTEILPGTIQAAHIAAGTITATQLAATAIDSMTITGATIRTAASAPKVEITSANGIRLVQTPKNRLSNGDFNEQEDGYFVGGAPKYWTLTLAGSTSGGVYPSGYSGNTATPSATPMLMFYVQPSGNTPAATSGNFAVTAGLSYTVAAMDRATTNPATYTFAIKWYDSAEALISTSTSSSVTPSTTWTAHTYAATAPAGAVSAQVVLSISVPSSTAYVMFDYCYCYATSEVYIPATLSTSGLQLDTSPLTSSMGDSAVTNAIKWSDSDSPSILLGGLWGTSTGIGTGRSSSHSNGLNLISFIPDTYAADNTKDNTVLIGAKSRTDPDAAQALLGMATGYSSTLGDGAGEVFAQVQDTNGNFLHKRILSSVGSGYTTSDFQFASDMSATLPSTPYDGQEHLYVVDGASAVVWRMRYDAGYTHWFCVGGSPLMFYGDTNVTTTSGSWTTIAGINTWSVLEDGNYLIDFGVRMYNQNTGGGSVQTGIFRNTTLQFHMDSYQGTAGSSITLWAGNTERKRVIYLTAGDTLSMKHIVNGGGTGNFESRWMSIMPVRFGS